MTSMDNNDISEKLTKLTKMIVNLNESECRSLMDELLRQQVDPLQITNACQEAINTIGHMYGTGEYYIAGLFMANEIVKELMDVLTPLLTESHRSIYKGRVLIGTVMGDIHDFGKNMAGSLLSAYGFQVFDLGVDVAPDMFLKKALEIQPEVVGLSTLLTSCQPNMKKTIKLIKDKWPHPNRPVVFISGPGVDELTKEKTGADFAVPDAITTVTLCESILNKKKSE